MQPDHKLYEEMARRGSSARWFWLAGIWTHVAGLLGIVLVLAVWPVMFYLRLGRTGLGYAFMLLGSAGLAALGAFLRRTSYRIALRDGIDIAAYFDEGDGKK